MREVLQGIYQQHAKDLFCYGLSLCQDKSVVEDAIHDLFIDLQTHFSTFSKAHDQKKYLFSALRNRIFKAMRRHPPLQNISAATVPAQQSAEEKIIMREEALLHENLVSEMLSSLSPRQREVLYLRFSQRMTYKQIAEQMSIGSQSAQNLFSRAVDKLRRIFLSETVFNESYERL